MSFDCAKINQIEWSSNTRIPFINHPIIFSKIARHGSLILIRKGIEYVFKYLMQVSYLLSDSTEEFEAPSKIAENIFRPPPCYENYV